MPSTTRKRSPTPRKPTIEEILIKGDYLGYRSFIRSLTVEQLRARIKDSRGRNLPYTMLDLANYVDRIEPKRGRIEEIVEHLHQQRVKTNVELREEEARTAKPPLGANKSHIRSRTGTIPGGIASLFKANTPRRKVFGHTRRRR